ncbi:hypothetical protein KY290_024783 [Solanum tuberosum]|uniref:Uncharacterized protein n=1 Tax=Solanum tuberosum TaxID=4113 RepID=A0ABQ7USV0_SOLTU|nr:hypothetical protein KY284_023642 [Solanum tuberosum]KAH0754513.1 hypothetical protein KY290_024783 [Solanum tuberosum]
METTNGFHVIGNSECITFEDVNQQNSGDQIAEHSNQIRGKEDIEQETSNFEFISNVPERENNDIRNLTENGAAVESGSRGHVREAHEPFHDNDAPRSEASRRSPEVVTDHEERNLRQQEAPYELVIEHGRKRRVSNLLQSGFCESLDQLIQSYVERQGHTSEWYMGGTLSSPDDMEHKLLQEYDNQDGP